MTAPTRPRASLAAEQTGRVLTAQAVAATLAVSYGLHAARVECGTGAVQLLPDGGHRFLGEPTITILTDPAGLLGWCATLGAAQVRLQLRENTIAASAGAVAHDHRWRVAATIPRSSGTRQADLPGSQPADRIPWLRNRATVGCARLKVALTARGLA